MNEQSKIAIDDRTTKPPTTERTFRQRLLHICLRILCRFFGHDYMWHSGIPKGRTLGMCIVCEQRFVRHADGVIQSLDLFRLTDY